MLFEMLYEWPIKQVARIEVRAKDEAALARALECAEREMRQNGYDHMDDLLHVLGKQEQLEVLTFEPEYDEKWEMPEYYDHTEIKEAVQDDESGGKNRPGN